MTDNLRDLLPTTTTPAPNAMMSGRTWVGYAKFDAGVTGRSAAVHPAITIPANTLVREVFIRVITVEDSTLTVDVGDGSDADRFVDGHNCENLGVSFGTATQKFYDTRDNIDVTFNNAADSAVFEIYAVCVDCTIPNVLPVPDNY